MRGLRTFALIFCAVAVLVACASKTEPEKSTPVTYAFSFRRHIF